jgi:tripartite-type tricarboxylate transporter receptor subunit TctC
MLPCGIVRKEDSKMREKMSFIKKCLVLAWVGVFCLMISFQGLMAAEKFPEKPIKILVGFSPGGTVDLQTRMLASLVGEDLGQPVVVINKPGASSTIAAAELAGSKPDGYTLATFPILVVSLTPFFVKIKYDPLKSFEPLVSISGSPYGICVLQNAPWKSFRELIEWARKNPGELSVSTPGAGTPQHASFEWIAKTEKIQWKHVPYPGGLPAATALLGGHVKAHFGSGSHLPFLESGQFRMLASYSPARDPKYPDVPTLKDLGYDLPATRVHFVAAPKGVPDPILKTLEDAFNKAERHDAYKGFLKQVMLEADFRNREEMRNLIESEYRSWDELLDKMGLKVK